MTVAAGVEPDMILKYLDSAEGAGVVTESRGHIEVQFGVDADEDALRTQWPSLWRWKPLPKC